MIKQYKKYLLSPYQVNYLKRWVNYLDNNTEKLRSNFQKIIEYFDNRNRAHLSDEDAKIQELNFFYGTDNLSFILYDWNSSRSPLLNGELLFDEFEHLQEFENNFDYPDEMEVYYEDFREGIAYTLKDKMTFTWMVKNWMELNGHHIGMFTNSIQNNSILRFSFNLINWEDCCEMPDPKIGEEVKYPLKRNLTDFEIKARVDFGEYTPFITKYRYFEKDDSFFEIGLYANLLGKRFGKISEYANIKFENEIHKYDYHVMRFELYKKVGRLCDNLINEGFEEKELPAKKIKLNENLIEWASGPFINKYKHIDFTKFTLIEEKIANSIPNEYKWYLSFTNGIEDTWDNQFFFISKNNFKKLSSFYQFSDLYSKALEYNENRTYETDDIKYLPIAQDIDANFILIYLENGTIHFNENGLIQIANNFEEFINSCTYPLEHFDPLRLHLQQNNIRELNKLFTKKWPPYSDPLKNEGLIHAPTNMKLIEMLCQHGIDPNKVYLKSNIRIKDLVMLEKYGLDIKKKLTEQDWLKKDLFEIEEFKTFLSKYFD